MSVVAVDIGGSKIEAAVVDNQSQISNLHRISTLAVQGTEYVTETIIELIVKQTKSSPKITAVGVSLPGFTNSEGVILFGGGTLKCLTGVNIKKVIEDRVHLPVVVENDANCFTLAEALYGAGKDHSIVSGVIWGTGIGSGLVINRQIYSGATNGAGEFGHLYIGPIENGKTISLEEIASGKAISNRYRQLGGQISSTTPKSIYFSKEPIATQVIDEAIHYLGLGLSILVNTINPSIIILGGGVSLLPDEVYDRLRQKVDQFALPALTDDLTIVRHQIAADAGILGAAALAHKLILPHEDYQL